MSPITDRLLRIEEVVGRCALSRPTLYRWIKGELFPRPLKIGPRAVRWRESEIKAWLEARPRTNPNLP